MQIELGEEKFTLFTQDFVNQLKFMFWRTANDKLLIISDVSARVQDKMLALLNSDDSNNMLLYRLFDLCPAHVHGGM